MKKLLQLITSILPAVLLLLLIGAGVVLAHYREQQITQRVQPVTSPTPTIKPTSRPSPSAFPSPKVTRHVTKPISGLITCTGPDGKQFQTTQKECDSFNAAWGNTPKIQLAPADLPSQQKYTETQSGQKQPPCTVGGYTYYYTDPATCTQWQQEQKEFEESLNNIQYIFTPPTEIATTQQDSVAAKDACKSTAQSKYNSAVMAAQTYGGNVQTAALEIARNDLNYELGKCEGL
ncbi:MAG: hypothetical protein COY81_02990 [Candidatus Pacebacteria bacterium CG_4_10_14_0_8_um_filter_43_12]|nr:MAG: hypothetical protein COY81_02990 [Candidatus Pacebacteria bacterium CG_4_10_14_0_8_um_filter_43_12]